VVLVVAIAVAVLAPVIAPGDPFSIRGPPFQPPQFAQPFGSDELGRSIFSEAVWGMRPSLIIGFSAMAIAALVGAVVGGISGYIGGRVDDLLMRITEMAMLLPKTILAIVIAALFGGSLIHIVVIIGGLSWPISARLVRSEFLTVREREFVEAARSIGLSRLKIIFGEILPNASSSLIVASTLIVGNAILTEAGLSFLGVGDQNIMTLGYMLNIGNEYMRYAWWTGVFPGAVLALLVLSTNFIGSGLTDALNPKLVEKAQL
jgi:peptide/nickel transport system permease protein